MGAYLSKVPWGTLLDTVSIAVATVSLWTSYAVLIDLLRRNGASGLTLGALLLMVLAHVVLTLALGDDVSHQMNARCAESRIARLHQYLKRSKLYYFVVFPFSPMAPLSHYFYSRRLWENDDQAQAKANGWDLFRRPGRATRVAPKATKACVEAYFLDKTELQRLFSVKYSLHLQRHMLFLMQAALLSLPLAVLQLWTQTDTPSTLHSVSLLCCITHVAMNGYAVLRGYTLPLMVHRGLVACQSVFGLFYVATAVSSRYLVRVDGGWPFPFVGRISPWAWVLLAKETAIVLPALGIVVALLYGERRNLANEFRRGPLKFFIGASVILVVGCAVAPFLLIGKECAAFAMLAAGMFRINETNVKDAVASITYIFLQDADDAADYERRYRLILEAVNRRVPDAVRTEILKDTPFRPFRMVTAKLRPPSNVKRLHFLLLCGAATLFVGTGLLLGCWPLVHGTLHWSSLSGVERSLFLCTAGAFGVNVLLFAPTAYRCGKLSLELGAIGYSLDPATLRLAINEYFNPPPQAILRHVVFGAKFASRGLLPPQAVDAIGSMLDSDDIVTTLENLTECVAAAQVEGHSA